MEGGRKVGTSRWIELTLKVREVDALVELLDLRHLDSPLADDVLDLLSLSHGVSAVLSFSLDAVQDLAVSHRELARREQNGLALQNGVLLQAVVHREDVLDLDV